VTAASATKAVAAEEIRARTGATRLVVFGDNHNDLSLFAATDEAYAVGNAVPEVLKQATGVVASNAEDRVGRWLAARLGGRESRRLRHALRTCVSL
jgi:hydroxymethylpyrimidine pyrophosphatase-like HAD family hydrolase